VKISTTRNSGKQKEESHETKAKRGEGEEGRITPEKKEEPTAWRAAWGFKKGKTKVGRT